MKRKIVMVWCLVVALVLTLCSCAAPAPAKNEQANVQPSRSVQVDGNSIGQPLASTDNNKEPEEQEPQETVNVHYNPDNAIFVDGEVTIRPYYVYWEGEELIADCYVLNGTDKDIFNIEVTHLSFSNRDGVIADAYFGIMEDLTLTSGEYTRWTFRFKADSIAQADADLYYLQCKSSIRWDP